MAVNPKLSVILPGLRGIQTILAALDSWRAQTAIGDLEILVLCPDPPEACELQANERRIDSRGMRLHEARALGVREASAHYVVLAEDHCFPTIPWVESMLPHLNAGYDVLAPALLSPYPEKPVPAAAFLLGYGQWMAPVEAGSHAHMPGHNIVVRRDRLLGWKSDLEKELIVASFATKRLIDEGARVLLEPRASMWHFDRPSFRRELRVFLCVGLGFGARRTSGWSAAGRAVYSLGAPLIAARHWWRGFTHYRRAGKAAGLGFGTLPVAAIWASAWGVGEALGSLAGLRRVLPAVEIGEIKPVSREEAELAYARMEGRPEPVSL